MSRLDLPLLVLTGAGISAESGVPTFRAADGLWERYSLEELATLEGFLADPERSWRWYDWRRGLIAACEPNEAHRTLVEIELWARRRSGSSGLGLPPSPAEETAPPAKKPELPSTPTQAEEATEEGFLLVTQNVDGLHEAAGSRNLRRLHGSIWALRCLDCGRETEDRAPALSQLPPLCPGCGGLLRPGVVWFGEMLDETILGEAFIAAEQARTVIVIGTSSLVYPAAAIPEVALRAGARVIEVNPEPTPLTPYVSERCEGPAARELPRWWDRTLSAMA